MSRWPIMLIYSVIITIIGVMIGCVLASVAHADDGTERDSVLLIAGGTVALENPQPLFLGPAQGFWLVGSTGTVPTAYNPATGQFGFLVVSAGHAPGFVPSPFGGGTVYATFAQTPSQFAAGFTAPPIPINVWNPGEVAPAGNPGPNPSSAPSGPVVPHEPTDNPHDPHR